jgi:hypothetical protein
MVHNLAKTLSAVAIGKLTVSNLLRVYWQQKQHLNGATRYDKYTAYVKTDGQAKRNRDLHLMLDCQ